MLSMLLASSAGAQSASDRISIELVSPVAKTQTYNPGGIQWSCTGTRCRGTGTVSNAEADCRAFERFSRQTVKTFISEGRLLNGCVTAWPAPSPTPAAAATLPASPAHAANLSPPKPLPVEIKGVTVTTGKLSYILVR